ncbi:Galactose/lactose metabolism regulatory protein GAL80 [Cercospora beticola]|uniref:Galactose/lactose metabolism regulatory protein GAL80 n=1 Tax=Cercospora beticola TaxID=122368 RepID=A0A2G5HNX6_CERBT|nr:Galactose/lactose metabolism regulatory protein GAL80 [Cercospora beticola]PIA94218.1 Galactose/lactose metabolism regulatory protein GAL80 [Cercospora beticola]WPB05190.1 hypothetical protein RHO25_009840 [Cercospora beticola]CAK1364979.1 unnamed protein product [Cercospora beticola]
MSPIRVGILGLSATSSWAVQAHLPYLISSPKYTITGVCNSSRESSQKAIDAHSLKDAKSYGTPDELAASAEIDLVVCAVRVDRHYDALKPAIAAGKDVFVEWPLASNSKDCKELLALAEEKGVKTMVGLQGQISTPIKRMKDLVDQGAIGHVISSSIDLWTALSTAETREGYEYLNFRELGGNMMIIPFGHFYDSVSYVLGELEYLSATLSTQYPEVTVRSSDGKVIDTIKRTTADQVTMSGLLASGAHSSAIVHGSAPFKGEPALIWRVEGDKGIIELRGETAFAVSMSGQVKIRLQDFATGEVKDIDFEGGDAGPPENIGRLYEAFADGKNLPDWKWAVRRHAWVDALYESHESGKRVSYA